MICQVFDNGTDASGSEVDYNMNQELHENSVTVWKGDPRFTKSLIKRNKNTWRYTSGVLSFSEPNLPRKAKHEIMSLFEKTIVPGFNLNQYDILWNEHLTHNRLELHWIIPRVELSSGKSMSVYSHEKDFKKKDFFQSYINARYGLTSPVKLLYGLTQKPRKYNIEDDRDILASSIHENVIQEIENGRVNNRNELIEYLKSRNLSIKGKNKGSITVIATNNLEPVMLKGPIYSYKFTSMNVLKEAVIFDQKYILIKDRDHEYKKKKISRSDPDALYEELMYEIDRHARENKERYPLPSLANISIKDIFYKRKNQGEKNDKIRNRIDQYDRERKRRVQFRTQKNHTTEQFDYRAAVEAHRSRKQRRASEQTIGKLTSYFIKLFEESFTAIKREISEHIEFLFRKEKVQLEENRQGEIEEEIDIFHPYDIDSQSALDQLEFMFDKEFGLHDYENPVIFLEDEEMKEINELAESSNCNKQKKKRKKHKRFRS